MKKVGLLFGSFNPVHIGHLLIARRMKELVDLNEVWMVLSPQNPFKINHQLLAENQRFELLKAALKNSEDIIACDVELHLSKPSFTIHTLEYLSQNYKDTEFSIIMGEDNIAGFTGWKEYETIANNHFIHVYSRKNTAEIKNYYQHSNIHYYDLPLMDISATEIRTRIQNGLSIEWMVPEAVQKIINDNKWYL